MDKVYVVERRTHDVWSGVHIVGVYADQEIADKITAAKQATADLEEAMDWQRNPCECGDRDCERRAAMFAVFTVKAFDVIR